MNMVVYPNKEQLDEVEVTIKMTMKLKEWKMISDALRKDSVNNYHWTKTEVAHAIENTVEEYHSALVKKVEP